MHKTYIGIALGVAMAVAISVMAGEDARKPEAPASAVIIIEPTHSREGIGRTEAISILDRATVAKLAAFFPNFEKRPSSDTAAPWDAGYRVYFNFTKGRAIRITVSATGGGDTWSVGDGDFTTKGDFSAFVRELRRRVTR